MASHTISIKRILLPALLTCWMPNIYPSWARETLASLSLEQKIGQLLIVAAVSDPGQLNTQFMAHEPYTMDPEYVRSLITNYHVGGVIFLGAGRIQEQIALTREFQSMATLPLLIAQDCEWGLTMRLVDAIRFPRAMTLGALRDPLLIYDLGKEIGNQMRHLGVHINLAPVVDVNTNPANPIIGSRSFGDNPENVALRSLLLARGLEDAGILACAKHFPGHGNTECDSHLALPCIAHPLSRLHSIELIPFKHLIDNGIACVMTAHMAVPAVTGNTHQPASTSCAVVTDLLRTQLGFHGLIITDGLGMRGITDHYALGQLELAALAAGNDILLCPVDVPRAIACIKQAVHDGIISETQIDEHVMRILKIKEKILTHAPESFAPVYNESILHNSHAYALQRTLYRTAITLVKDTAQLLAIQPSGTTHLDIILVNAPDTSSAFTAAFTTLSCTLHINELPVRASNGSVIICALYNVHQHAHLNYGIDKNLIDQLRTLKEQGTAIIICIFGSPYSLALLNDCADTIILGYEDAIQAQEAVADVILGNLAPHGAMPIVPLLKAPSFL